MMRVAVPGRHGLPDVEQVTVGSVVAIEIPTRLDALLNERGDLARNPLVQRDRPLVLKLALWIAALIYLALEFLCMGAGCGAAPMARAADGVVPLALRGAHPITQHVA